MGADALDPCIAMPSSGILLTMEAGYAYILFYSSYSPGSYIGWRMKLYMDTRMCFVRMGRVENVGLGAWW